jgi:hypothetical protein
LSVTAYEADNLTVYFFASHTHNLNVNIGLENISRDCFFSTASAEISTSIKSIHNTTNTTIFFHFYVVLCSQGYIKMGSFSSAFGGAFKAIV